MHGYGASGAIAPRSPNFGRGDSLHHKEPPGTTLTTEVSTHPLDRGFPCCHSHWFPHQIDGKIRSVGNAILPA